MNIEVLLTEAEIAGEFRDSLEARDLPEKFFYWSPLSVGRWLALSAVPAYTQLFDAWTALAGRAPEICSEFGEAVPVISFGAGDGAKDRLLLNSIRAAGKKPTYFPVDASQSLLETACAAAEDAEFDAVGIKADIASRMHVLLAADAAEAPRLFVLSGNTLGGFDPFEQLKNLADAMRAGDKLLIDGEMQLPDSPGPGLSAEFRDFAFGPLAALGVDPDDGRIRFEEKRDTRHEGLTLIARSFQADRDLRILTASNAVALARGERIFLNFHYLYTPEAFSWLLEGPGGLKVEQRILSPDSRFITAVCSK